MHHHLRVDGSAALAPPARSAEVIARLLAAALALTSIAILLVGAIGSERWQTAVGERGPSCIVRMVTGFDCPFCGMTHATLALGAGDLHRAFGFHPLAPLVLAGALLLFVLVAAGRGSALLVGRRPLVLLASIAAIWIVRLAA